MSDQDGLSIIKLVKALDIYYSLFWGERVVLLTCGSSEESKLRSNTGRAKDGIMIELTQHNRPTKHTKLNREQYMYCYKLTGIEKKFL